VADPRISRLIGGTCGPRTLASADPQGHLALPAAMALHRQGSWLEAASWLRRATIPVRDRAYAAALVLECLRAGADTIGAGAYADSILGAWPNGPASSTPAPWPSAIASSLRQARLDAALAAGDLGRARRLLGEEGRGLGNESVARARLRLEALAGHRSRADSLAWEIASVHPSGATAKRLLQRFVPGGIAGTPPVLQLGDRQREILLACAEKSIDLDRYDTLLRQPRSPGGRPAVRLEEAAVLPALRLAWKARQYERLIGWARQSPRPSRDRGREVVGEHALLIARAFRNSGQPDSMASWYARAAERGTASQRADAYWEWAREMESLRRFQMADTLYSRFLRGQPGDRGHEARIRQGLDSYARGDLERARRILHGVAGGSAGDAPTEIRASAAFWLYRTELARGDHGAARAALSQAAGFGAGGGYYGWRGRTALAAAAEPGGPGALEPAGYWSWAAGSLRRAAPSLEGSSREVTPPEPGRVDNAALKGNGTPEGEAPWEPGEEVAYLRDRLQLFRLHGRTSWAEDVQKALLARSEIGEGRVRVGRLGRLGLPDLAAREAIRLKLSGTPLRYPTPFRGPVAAAAARLRLPTSALWAVMRRESFFESSALSKAGAVGLMQLMEDTARRTAERHALPGAPLSSPLVNLQLGAAHLRDLLDEEPEAWPVVLAAYNAGMHNARRWKREGEDQDFYIEMIGYRETRDYVKKVLEAMWLYEDLLRTG